MSASRQQTKLIAASLRERDKRSYDLGYQLTDGFIEENEYRAAMKHELGFDDYEIAMKLEQLSR